MVTIIGPDRNLLRTFLQYAALAALLALWAITAYAVMGPHPLPARIPTHFDLAGKPNGWGQPGHVVAVAHHRHLCRWTDVVWWRGIRERSTTPCA